MPATTISPSLRSALERLKHAGSVNGICLAWRRQVLVNLLPFEDFRAERCMQMLLDAREHFEAGGRSVDNFWFGYDDCDLLAVFFRECTLVILHTQDHEIDFIHHAASTCLHDCQLLIDSALNPSNSGADGEETQRLTRGTESATEATDETSGTHVIPRG